MSHYRKNDHHIVLPTNYFHQRTSTRTHATQARTHTHTHTPQVEPSRLTFSHDTIVVRQFVIVNIVKSSNRTASSSAFAGGISDPPLMIRRRGWFDNNCNSLFRCAELSKIQFCVTYVCRDDKSLQDATTGTGSTFI
jgi:hypothetical protein